MRILVTKGYLLFCGVSDMVGHRYSVEKIMEEIAKCEIRCSNCHKKATMERGQRGSPVGAWY